MSEPLALTPSEQRALIDLGQGEGVTGPYELIHRRFEARAREFPAAIAIRDVSAELSYGELDERANRLAQRLVARGVLPGDVVAVGLDRSAGYVISLLAILKAGAAYLPIELSSPPARVTHMLRETAASCVITQGEKLTVPEGPWRTLLLEEPDDAPARPSPKLPEVAEALAYVIYTSGSTGKPKGVAVPHRGVMRLLASAEVGRWSPQTRLALVLNVAFDPSTHEVWGTLLHGGQIVIQRSQTVTIESLADAVSRGANTFMCGAGLFHHLVELGLSPLRGVTRIFVGGELLKAQDVRRALDALPDCQITNVYGPTENAIVTTCRPVKAGALPEGPAIPIGRPIGATQVYLLDEQLRPVPLGQVGELCTAGDGLAWGYCARPDLTAERFVPNPFSGSPGARLYRTGDLARWREDGELEYVGRRDTQLKVRGFRVELGEIEAALIDRPEVRDAVVVARDDGGGVNQILAYVVPRAADAGRDRQAGVIGAWGDLFDESYQAGASEGDGTFNISGWKSSYTGAPIPAEQMREWTDATVARILALKPRRVLEIGSGSGLLLFRVAPRCDAYVGLDLSARAVQHVRSQLEGRPELAHVRVERRAAHELDGLPGSGFDTVVINSVLQYFPDADYLVDVLQRAEKLLAPGGRIFLGDVRSLGTLRAFATSVQLAQAPDGLTRDELAARVQGALQRERELVLRQELFAALRSRLPLLSHVRLEPKRGSAGNEMTDFRFDATLLFGGGPPQPSPAPAWTEWGDAQPTEAALFEQLQRSPHTVLALRGVPNRRTARDFQAMKLLDGEGKLAHVRDLKAALQAQEVRGLDPELLWKLGEAAGHRVELGWFDQTDAEGHFQVVIVPRGVPGYEQIAFRPPTAPAWADVATHPAAQGQTERLCATLMEELGRLLPAYMLPHALMVVGAIPLTSNGKVDRKALPVPESRSAARAFIAPTTPIQIAVARIWEEVLAVRPVGLSDDFFSLGGHSLSAMRATARLAEATGKRLSVETFVQRRTLSGVCEALERAPAQEHPVLAPAAGGGPLPQTFPLSFAQEQLWLHHERSPDSIAYNVGLRYELAGPLDEQRLQGAFQALLREQRILRARVHAEEGRAVQSIAPEAPFALERADLTALPVDAQPGEVHLLAKAFVSRPFQLRAGSLLRALLIVQGPDRHVLVVAIHHIVCDGWSCSLLTQSLSRLYAAAGPPQPPALDFSDFVRWQRASLSDERQAELLEFWRGHLGGASFQIELPSRPIQPAAPRRASGEWASFQLSAELAARLERLASHEQATAYHVLLAGLGLVLSRYARQTELVLGNTFFNRASPSLEGMMGHFVHVVPLRLRLGSSLTVRQLVAQAKEAALATAAHGELPLQQLVSGLGLPQSESGSPLQVALVLLNVPPAALRLPGCNARASLVDTGASALDLSLILEPAQTGYQGRILYDGERYEPALIQQLARDYVRALEAMVQVPERALGAISLLTAAERERLTHMPVRQVDSPPCLHQTFEAHAERTPQAPAVTCNGVTWTYAELNARANQLAHRLTALGVGPGARVGLLLERSLDMVATVLAIMKAGGAYVPLEPAYPQELRAFIVADAGASLIVTQRSMEGALPAPASIPRLWLDGDGEQLARMSTANPQPRLTSEHLAYVIYTSGSTGRPKGTLIPHVNVARLFASSQRVFRFREDDVWTFFHSIAFDWSVYELWGALLHGGRVVVVPHLVSRSPEEFHALLAREQVTFLCQTPSAFQALVHADQRAGTDGLALRWVLLGGEAVELEALRPWFDRHGFERPTVTNVYGITETTVISTYRPLRREDFEQRSSPIGVPFDCEEIFLLDERLEPVPPGVVGELYLAEQLAWGYLGRPELAAERFVPNPFSPRPGARMYKSGDLARRNADGGLDFVGRSDHQVKIRGFRIELGAIESVLLRQPAVRGAAVVARKDAERGHELAAYVVPDPKQLPSLSGALDQNRLEQDGQEWVRGLRAQLRQALPEYMVPTAWAPVLRLPLTPNGKLDTRALPRPRALAGAVSAPPSTPAEKALVEIWKDVLSVPSAGVDDNFFDLGGHSLKCIRVVQKAYSAGWVLTLQQALDLPTIRALAAVATPVAEPEEAQADAPRSIPPGPAISFLLEHAGPWLSGYSVYLVAELPRQTDEALLSRAFAELHDQQEILRASLRLQPRPELVIHPPGSILPYWEVAELSGLAPGDQEAEISRIAKRLMGTLQLEKPPLLRMAFIQLGPDRAPRLVVVQPFLLLDAAAKPFLWEQLWEAYQRLREGRPAPGGPRGTTLSKWNHAQAQQARRGDFSGEQEFWRRQERALAPLPVDFPGGSNQARDGQSLEVALDARESRLLLKVGTARARTRINDYLLTALERAMTEWSGNAEHSFLLVNHGRASADPELDSSRLLGRFAVYYPLILAEPPGASARESLALTEARLREVPQGGANYCSLRYASGAETQAAAPLAHPQVLFEYIGEQAPAVDSAPVVELSSGVVRAPQMERHALFSVIARHEAPDRLVTRFGYSQSLHRRATVERIAEHYLDALRELLAGEGAS